jgi:hypothetical protein
VCNDWAVLKRPKETDIDFHRKHEVEEKRSVMLTECHVVYIAVAPVQPFSRAIALDRPPHVS